MSATVAGRLGVSLSGAGMLPSYITCCVIVRSVFVMVLGFFTMAYLTFKSINRVFSYCFALDKIAPAYSKE